MRPYSVIDPNFPLTPYMFMIMYHTVFRPLFRLTYCPSNANDIRG